MTEVGAGVANKLVLDEEEQATGNPSELTGADGEPANDPLYRMDGLDAEDPTHTFSAELSSQGVAIFNYSMQDRMSGDGGTVNKAGYINFNPLGADDVSLAKQRERDADLWLHITLEQLEAARRLAELEARRAELLEKIKDLTSKIEAADRVLDLMDDSDLNDHSMNGLAKRNELRESLTKIGLNADDYFNPDGTVNLEKLSRDRALIEARKRGFQTDLDTTYRDLRRVDDQIAAERERNKDRNVGQIRASAAGDPAAVAQVRNQSSTGNGFRELSTTILDNPASLSKDEQKTALIQSGLLSSDKAVAVTSNPDDAFSSVAALGFSTELPPAAPAVQAARLPETLPELLAPVNAALPADMQIPAPNIKLIDMIPQGVLTGANTPSTTRATGSFAAELGMDDATGGIKPISSTFARAMNGEIPAADVASAEATFAAATVEKDRLATYSSGTSGVGGMKV